MKRLAPAALLLVACSPSELPPLGQVRLFLDTDAILPPAPGEQGSDAALFDRLRIEIFPAGAGEPCEGCVRELGIDHDTVFEGRASFGIVPEAGETGHRVRVRLYRSGGSDVVEARPTSTLEAVVALPATQAEGIVDAHIRLNTSDLGTPQGTLDAPIDALEGPALGGLAGTFAAEYRRGCAGAPQDGEVCVPGGAFWMGDPSFGAPTERLVVLSPFYLDATEVTVGQLRGQGVSTPLTHQEGGKQHLCTFTANPGPFEALPVNCIPQLIAKSYCEARGGALVSEAQWELAASARRSAPYVWGTDEPACEDAVFSRFQFSNGASVPGKCADLGLFTQPPGSGKRDRLDLPGGTILDLAGNLTEWMRDDWEPEGETCWKGPLLFDPICVSDANPLSYTLRGSSYASTLSYAAERTFDPVMTLYSASAQTGFRCARTP